MSASLRPLSDQIVEHLPGRRGFWIVLWALVPWLNAGANLLLGDERTSAVWEQGTVLVVLNYAALSFGVALALLGTRRIVRQLADLGATKEAVIARGVTRPFRGMNSAAGSSMEMVIAHDSVTAEPFSERRTSRRWQR